jgi:hypothetical protein
MAEKIKTCPICGSESTVIRWEKDGNRTAYVKCHAGDCMGVEVCGRNREAVIEQAVIAWNRRPREEALERLLRDAHDRLLRKTALSDDGGIAFLNSVTAALREEKT